MPNWRVTAEPPIEELRKKLAGVPPKIQKKGLRLGTTAALKPITTRMRQSVPVRTGILKKAIGYRTLGVKSKMNRGFPTDAFVMEAGVIKKVVDPYYSRSPGKKISQEFKGQFIEYGVRAHSVARGARLSAGKLQDQPPVHPGFSPRRFFNPAYNAESPLFANRFAGAIDQFLEAI